MMPNWKEAQQSSLDWTLKKEEFLSQKTAIGRTRKARNDQPIVCPLLRMKGGIYTQPMKK